MSIAFLVHGLSTGTWLARIPAVQEHLALGEAALGLALLGGGLGSLVTMVPVGALIARCGSRTIVLATAFAVGLALCAIALAWNGLMLFGALVLWGASAGSLDVAMNTQGSSIEQRRAQPIMSSLHGLWSLGTMAGGGISALLSVVGVPFQSQFLAEGPLVLLTIVLSSRLMHEDGGGRHGVSFALPRGSLLALAVVTFCAVTAEGAMFDWSGVYLRRTLAAPEATAASSASVVAGAISIGRLGGDFLTARFGPPALARACALLAATGMVTVIAATTPTVVFAGLVAVGFGISILVPLAFSAAGRAPGMAPGAAIAAVATVGYFGFLAAPPTIGIVAERVTLRGAFVMLLALLILIGILAPVTGQKRDGSG